MIKKPMQNLPLGGGQLPPMPSGMMGADASVPMSQEEMRADLQAGYDKVKNKERQVNSARLMSQNQIYEFKKRVIQDVFKMMKRAGVDPSNLESIRGFIEKLEQQNPDIAEMFKLAFEGMVGNEEDEELPPEGLMGKFGNLSQQMMGEGEMRGMEE